MTFFDISTNGRRVHRIARWLQILNENSRPVDTLTRAALVRRWHELPEAVRTPAQTLGRFGVGCEGTHGVFPRCNFACTPCYHSADANRVRIDGEHSIREIEDQMALLERSRAPHAHAQLIGGEVTLLSPEDHAGALEVMRRHGREPMSFSHGDFDYDYLEKLALRDDGTRRFARISFALHIDTTMKGRRDIRRATSEEQLNPYRARAVQMFERLRREHGVNFYLAHNVTVTPDNVDQIPDVVRGAHGLGFGMFSFQPAAFVGDERRWRSDYSKLDPDEVWRRIEEGAGTRLPYQVLEVGDTRCNRTAWGFYVGDEWFSFINDLDPKDLKARDALLAYLGGVHFSAPRRLLALRLTRVALRHPSLVPTALGWLGRTVRRAGGVRRLIKDRPRPTTFVMHRFMHAADVAPAWEMLQRGEMSSEPRILETQERLLACSYAMAHPETGELVPACVQHGVLDPDENASLATLLPLPRRRGVGQSVTADAKVGER
ncbi:MAG: radical SAM protein [Acidimicrobiales bacterium]